METRTRSGRRRTADLALAFAVVAAAASGCGKNRVTVDVDVASFIDPADLTAHYQAPPFVPPLELNLDPVSVNLVEGFQDFGQAEEISVDMSVRYDNQSGQGQARFTLYFSDTASTVFETPPVASIDANLTPESVSVGATRFEADQRVLDLFTQKQMWMGVKFSWTPETSAALVGDYTITRIDAHVVSTVEIF
ncbi:MAG: hypothetical protein ACE5G2_09190 [Candidatus Krumholzibacteriia bacterium]